MTRQTTCTRQKRNHTSWHWATWWTAGILLAAAIGLGCVSHYSRGADGDNKTQHGFFAAGTDCSQLANGVDEALDHIDATPEQRAEVKAIVARHAPRLEQLQQQWQAEEQRLQALWDADKLDVQAISATRARCERLARETARQGLELMDQLMKVLTVEQRREVVARWKEHAA